MHRRDAISIWRNNSTPVVYRQPGKRPLLVKVPYALGNPREWLTGKGHRITWQPRFKAWEIPRSRFEDIVERCLAGYEQTYIIEAYRPLEKCAPACWNAIGHHCECSCMGANHGSERELKNIVSDTFAFEWGDRRLACRLVRRKAGNVIPFPAHQLQA